MTDAAAPARHSTRSSYAPLTLAEEQAASVLSRLEQRDVAAAMRCSLASSWEADEDDDAAVAESDDEEEEEEKEEKKEQPATQQQLAGWSAELRDIEVPLPRLRHLQNRPPPAGATPLQLLQHFLPLQLMEEFAQHTNDAAPQDWRHTTAAELYAFLGVHIFMGIKNVYKSKMDPLHGSVNFPKIARKTLRRKLRLNPFLK
jgi:Transposase IS4